MTYKRLTREIAVPAGGGDLTFWTSYDTEPDWDFLAVEARTAGGNDWTTLPDARPATTTPEHGRELPGGERRGLDGRCTRTSTTTRRKPGSPATCTPTGTSGGPGTPHRGARTAGSSGRSTSTSYAGKTVEISIAYISDWGTQNLGVFLDDFAWPGGSTSFEGTDTGGWQITGPPAGSGANSNNFAITDAGGFPVGASITTPKSLLFGYGFEAISTADAAQRGDGQGRVATCCGP